MLLFPIIYIVSFVWALQALYKKQPEGFLLFIIVGLPIYTTTLSVCFISGLAKFLPLLQSFKEILALLSFGIIVWNNKRKIELTKLDKLVLLYFAVIFLYACLPIGLTTLTQRLIALKNISFFTLIYYIGRLIHPIKVNLNKYFYYICLMAVAAALVVCYEVITNTHLQTRTGYADFIYYILNQEPGGNYGLTWTFETENGLKRFASFFSMPLEHAAATVVTVAVIMASVTKKQNKIVFNHFFLTTLIATLISIAFALSRASFVSYFIVLYVYAYITERKMLLKIFHYTVVGVIAFFLILIKGDLYDFIINTIDFTDSSSVSHMIAWLDSINSIVNYPFGLGLGTSGNVGAAFNNSVGGESQIFVIGIQAGVIPLLIYIVLYVSVISTSIQYFRTYSGKIKKLALMILLVRVGLIIPSLTSELESYIYISYIVWFFTGYMVNVAKAKPVIHKIIA